MPQRTLCQVLVLLLVLGVITPYQVARTPVAQASDAPLNTWQIIGPNGGDMRSITIDPVTPTTVYAGTRGGSIFKSTNRGTTWAPVYRTSGDVAREVFFSKLTIDPKNPATIYATSNIGLLKTTNAGQSWSFVVSEFFGCFAIDPATPSTLYAGFLSFSANKGQIWKSMNGGLNWNRLAQAPALTACTSIVIDPTAPQTLYISDERIGATDAGKSIYKSTDGGATFTPVVNGLASPGYVGTLAISPFASQTVYAGESSGVYMSTTAGQSWALLSSDVRFARSIRVDPLNPQVLYAATYDATFKSTNGGRNWQSIASSGANSFWDGLAIDPATPTLLYRAAVDGIYKSLDAGATWSPANAGLSSGYIEALAVHPSAPNIVLAGTASGVYKTSDGGATWALKNSGITPLDTVNWLTIDASDPNTVYAATPNTLFKSGSGGESWVKIATTGLPSGVVRDLTVDPFNPTRLYLRLENSQKPGIYQSNDSGLSWATITAAIDRPTSDLFYPYSFYSFAVDQQDSQIMYVGTKQGLFKTSDAGRRWRQLTRGLPPDRVAWTIAVDPTDSAHVFASVFGTVYRSSDGGDSWQAVTDDVWCRMLLIDPTNHTTIYASVDSSFSNTTGNPQVGLLRSTDGGDSWQTFTVGEAVPSDARLALVPTSPIQIFAGSKGRGILGIKFSISGVNVGAPRGVVAGAPFAATATVLNTIGQAATEYNGPVTLRLKGVGILGGITTAQAQNGVAVFPSLTLDTPHAGNRLLAAAGDLAGGISQLFTAARTGVGSSDEAEPNNRLSQATPLIYDQHGIATSTGIISDSSDVDIYSLTTLPGANVALTLQNLPTNYNLLLLADPLAVSGSDDGTNLGNVSDIGQDSIGQDSIGQDSIGQDSIGQDSIGQDSIGQDSIALSAKPGTTPESIQTTLARGGRYYVVVYGANGVFDPQRRYTLSATIQDGTLQDPVLDAQFGRGIAAQRNPAIKTVFVTNLKRFAQLYPADPPSVAALQNQLSRPALLNVSQGVVLDISQNQDPAANDRLDALYGRWDAAADQPLLANALAQQIWNILDRAIVTKFPNAEHIVLVGGDDVIPFYRVPDDTELGNERDYGRTLQRTGAFAEGTPLGGALRYSFFQTDDFYADRKPTPWRGRQLFMPDQAIGRLVESPAEIVRYLATYTNSTNPTPYTIDAAGGASFVTGYDFLTDQAQEISATLKLFGLSGNSANRLISNDWDAATLSNVWFGGRFNDFSGLYSGIETPWSLSSLNSHFTHFDAIPAKLNDAVFDAQRIYAPTSASAASGYFKRNGGPTLLYSVGCHSGLSASDRAFPSDLRYATDFAQGVLKQGGNWIGNTGYGIGDTDVVGYSERLALLFTRNLGRKLDVGPYTGVSIGESLALAKRQYLQTSGPNGFGLFDEKIMNEWTLYGLPFIRATVPTPQRVAALNPPNIPSSILPTLAASNGLFTRIITVTTGFAPLAATNAVPQITSATVQDEFAATPRELIVTTSTGRDRPVLPALVYDLTMGANTAVAGIGSPQVRGVRLRSATTLPDIPNFDPHVTTPITDQLMLDSPTSRPLTNIGAWLPNVPYTFQRTASVFPGGSELVGSRPGDVTDKLIMIPVQVKADTTQTGRLRRFSQMVFEVSYADPRTASADVLARTNGPAFERVEVLPVRAAARSPTPPPFVLRATLTTPPEQLREVSATFTVNGAWQRIILPRGADGRYSTLVMQSYTPLVSVFFEAIDTAGNVAVVFPRDEAIPTTLFLPLTTN